MCIKYCNKHWRSCANNKKTSKQTLKEFESYSEVSNQSIVFLINIKILNQPISQKIIKGANSILNRKKQISLEILILYLERSIYHTYQQLLHMMFFDPWYALVSNDKWTTNSSSIRSNVNTALKTFFPLNYDYVLENHCPTKCSRRK